LIESDRDYQLQRLSLKTWDAYDQATARWQALADMTTAKWHKSGPRTCRLKRSVLWNSIGIPASGRYISSTGKPPC
jgi:hypothetical protein